MNHSASGSSARAAAPSARFLERTARMMPSAPTPKCRSQIALICSGVSSSSPSGSANSTKSFPVPCPLVKCRSIAMGKVYGRVLIAARDCASDGAFGRSLRSRSSASGRCRPPRAEARTRPRSKRASAGGRARHDGRDVGLRERLPRRRIGIGRRCLGAVGLRPPLRLVRHSARRGCGRPSGTSRRRSTRGRCLGAGWPAESASRPPAPGRRAATATPSRSARGCRAPRPWSTTSRCRRCGARRPWCP